jgi:hypothetical protein
MVMSPLAAACENHVKNCANAGGSCRWTRADTLTTSSRPRGNPKLSAGKCVHETSLDVERMN